jgi:hypothetical protein
MPPRHHKGTADAVGPPEPDDPRNRSPEEDLLHRADNQGDATTHRYLA